jgi:glycosyltransferase involved in cell wall biosynthesis
VEESLVSCIVATYNDGKYLNDCVPSILNQTHKNLQCIVIDDGSTDDTPTIVKQWFYDPRFTYKRLNHCGVARARNEGIRLSSGKYIAFLDADDWWDIGKVEGQLSYMAKNPDIGFCWSDQRLIDLSGRDLGVRNVVPSSERSLAEQILLTGWSAPTCLMVKSDLLKRVGCYDDRLFQGEDVELIFRLAVNSKGGRAANTFFYRRIRAGSTSRDVSRKQRETIRVFEIMLAYQNGKYCYLRPKAMHFAHRFLAGHCWENGAFYNATVEALLAAFWKPSFIFSRDFRNSIFWGHVNRVFDRYKIRMAARRP